MLAGMRLAPSAAFQDDTRLVPVLSEIEASLSNHFRLIKLLVA